MAVQRTYADGYGRWHVITDDSPRALALAVNAIVDALAMRENTTRADLFEYVNRNIISVPTDEMGTLHFTERH